MERSIGETVEAYINTSPTSGERRSDTHDYTIQVDKLVNSIAKKQAQVHPSSSIIPFIFRVPKKLREINPKAYDPCVVSIGPFHHGDVRYKSMEEFKTRSLNKLVQRNTKVLLRNYVEFLKAQETSVRQSYSEIIEMDSDEFLTMLLLDSCFLIEFMLCRWNNADRDVDYAILSSSRLWVDLRLDLILLENQIPFFVLEGLYSLAMTDSQPIPLISIAVEFFSDFNRQHKPHNGITSIKHFTDLILTFFRPMSPSTAPGVYLCTKTITELDEAGLKFKKSTSKCLLDIKFSGRILEIPCIQFTDSTQYIFRNLMALEESYYYDDSYITDYLMFLDYLINTHEDVDLLVQSGIIENRLGDNQELADIINNMNTNVGINAEKYKFSSLSNELNAFCKIPTHRWRAALIRDYFSSPWRSASTLAAIFLIELTLIQTFLSILSAARGH